MAVISNHIEGNLGLVRKNTEDTTGRPLKGVPKRYAAKGALKIRRSKFYFAIWYEIFPW